MRWVGRWLQGRRERRCGLELQAWHEMWSDSIQSLTLSGDLQDIFDRTGELVL